MTYNIHPLFVHFPIALLLVYSVIKILPFRKWFPQIAWKDIERIVLFVGVLGAFAASQTGEIAEHLTRPDEALVEMHALFAAVTTWCYALLLVGEILFLILPTLVSKFGLNGIIRLLTIGQKVLTQPLVSKLLALVGLIAISVTGILGGVLVYGLTADPVAPIVLRLLGITL